MNKKKGKPPAAISKACTVRLELWAEGTYILEKPDGDMTLDPNEGKPVALKNPDTGKAMTKPTLVNMKVNIR